MLEPTIYDYWRIIAKRKRMFVLIFLVTVSSTAIYTRFQPEVYRSEATITFKPPAAYSKIPGSEMDELDPRSAVQTEVRVINSLEIAGRAAVKTGFLPGLAGAGAKDRISARMRDSYKAERLQDSNLISLSATGPDPASACAAANAVIESYKEYNLEQKSKQAKKRLEDIASRRGEVEDSLRSLERQKQNFIKRNPGSGMGVTLANQLSDLEFKRNHLLEKYTPNHPDVFGIDQRIEAAQEKLDKIPSQEIELVRISREVRMQEELYTTLNKQYEEAKLGLSSVISFVGVVDPPVAGDSPISPKAGLNLAISGLLGIFLSMAVVFILENLDISIGTIEDIEEIVKLPVLGVIPGIASKRRLDNWLADLLRRERMSLHNFRGMLLSNKHAAGLALEFYCTLRSNILARLKNRRGASLVFCSAGKAEGKTLTAINFSLACVSSGMKALIIDADIRRPWMHTVLGMNRSPGLSDILAGKVGWRDAVLEGAAIASGGKTFTELHKFPGMENLSALGCGSPCVDVTDLMDSADWPSLMAELREEFDIVIIDAPPVLAFLDSLIVAKHSDGVVLVYKAGKMGRSALKRAKEQIIAANANVIGVVLNSVHRTDMYSYYDYYGESY